MQVAHLEGKKAREVCGGDYVLICMCVCTGGVECLCVCGFVYVVCDCVVVYKLEKSKGL